MYTSTFLHFIFFCNFLSCVLVCLVYRIKNSNNNNKKILRLVHARQQVVATCHGDKSLCVYWRTFVKSFVSATNFCRWNMWQNTKSDRILFLRQRFSQKFSSIKWHSKEWSAAANCRLVTNCRLVVLTFILKMNKSWAYWDLLCHWNNVVAGGKKRQIR